MNKVYDIVKNTILERLQDAIDNNKEFLWIKPWNGNHIPRNFKSKNPYRGINLMILPYGGFYLTFNQIKEMKGKVRKGSKSFPVFFWKFNSIDKDSTENKSDDNSEDKKNVPIFKYYTVFHQSQIDGIDFGDNDDSDVILDNDIESFIKSYNEICPINVIKDSIKAFYSPSNDSITVPTRNQFNTINMFYSVLFHEIIHSTGHKSRLDRLSEKASFGNDVYSKEELTAEIGSCLMKAYFSVNDNECDNLSIAYLKSWYKYLKNGSPSEIVFACQYAQKAVDYIFDKTMINFV